MKAAAWLLLGGGVWFHLVQWKNGRNEAHNLCSYLAFQAQRGEGVRFEGSAIRLPSGRWALMEARYEREGRWKAYSGEVHLGADSVSFSSTFGHRVRLSGPFRCSVERRNPAQLNDGLWRFELPRVYGYGQHFRVGILPKSTGPLSSLQRWCSEKLASTLEDWPGLKALVGAVWTGEEGHLPKGMADLYLEAGLLHVLALSGQHVVILVLLCSLLLGAVQRLCGLLSQRSARWSGHRHLSRLLPLVCCTVLFITSHGCPSVVRMMGMLVFFVLLRYRGLETTLVQTVLSASACVILLQPSLLGRPGFVLSTVATVLLCQILGEHGWKKRFYGFLFVSIVMPILVFPLTAFYFAKVSWCSPASNLLLSWLWDFFWIPVGFLLPFVMRLLPPDWGSVILNPLEDLWNWFVGSHHLLSIVVEGTYRSCIRPTALEWSLMEGLLLIGVLVLKEELESRFSGIGRGGSEQY